MENIIASEQFVLVLKFLTLREFKHALTVCRAWRLIIDNNCSIWLCKAFDKVNCQRCMAFFHYTKQFFCVKRPGTDAIYWKNTHRMLVTRSRLIRQWRIKCAKRIMISSHVDSTSKKSDNIAISSPPISTVSLISLLDNFCKLECATLLSAADCRTSMHENHFTDEANDAVLKFSRVSEWKIFCPDVNDDLLRRSRITKGQIKEMRCLLSDLEALVNPTLVPNKIPGCKDVFWYASRARASIANSSRREASVNSSDNKWYAGSERSILVAIKFSDVAPYTKTVVRVAALTKLRSDGIEFC